MTLNGYNGWIQTCAFSPQGDRLVSTGLDSNMVRLWDIQTGELLMTFNGHEAGVLSCAFSPQGDRVISTGMDSTLRLWDAQTGSLLRIHAFTDIHAREPGHAVFDAENNHLIEACGDIWRTLAWVRRGPDGWPERLPLEIFGPMPRPKRMKTNMLNSKTNGNGPQ
jgi:WD40 repeat protein